MNAYAATELTLRLQELEQRVERLENYRTELDRSFTNASADFKARTEALQRKLNQRKLKSNEANR